MDFFRNFFRGRYGIDQLSLAMLIAGAAALLLARVLRFPPLSLLYSLFWILCIFRMLSKNIQQRARENHKYLSVLLAVRRRLRLYLQMIREWNTHRYLKCPRCGQRLRVPKGKGKISIRCSGCGDRFIKKV